VLLSDPGNQMKMIPVLKCTEMKTSIKFYIEVLHFPLKYPELSVGDFVVDPAKGEAEFWPTSLKGDQRPGCKVYVSVDDVDSLFEKHKIRGLDTSQK
jgi:hypothetical protein